MKTRIAVLGDIHFPFENTKALGRALSEIKKINPTHVVQVGDLYDQYSFSRFTRKNIINSDEELKQARLKGIKLWKDIKKIVGKKTRCYQLLGNHDMRLIKRTEEKIPEAQNLVRESVMELYRFEGVTTIEDDREELIIGDICFIHGYRSRPGDHMRFNRRSTVVGHSHTGGVVYEQQNGKILFELNAGFLADETAEPLKYRPQKTCKWSLGLGVIDEKGPRFIPL